MGITVDRPALQESLNRSTAAVLQRIDALQHCEQACDNLAEDPRLTSQAWQVAKDYANHQLKPLLKNMERANESAITANRRFSQALDTYMDADYMDEDAIRKAINQLKKQDGELDDMDAINIKNRVKDNPGEDPMKVAQDYYSGFLPSQDGKSDAARAREFCGNYDPEGKGDPRRGLKFIREHGMQISTGSPGGTFLGKHHLNDNAAQQKLDEFTDLLQQDIG